MSVFTYIHDLPRVSSPWLDPADASNSPSPRGRSRPGDATREDFTTQRGVTKLRAEPQDGPTEYKLHLLLRQRRKYTWMSTTTKIAGSQQARPTTEPRPAKQIAVTLAPSNQTRQARLLQLTSQLFWRLQQSSPYHASTSPNYLIPYLPDDNVDLTSVLRPGPMLQGIEESRGALYEIGVADDGTLVGLTKEELDESVLTLRVMAASLGCQVETLRTVHVGNCEWTESVEDLNHQENAPRDTVRNADLWVCEALVMPFMGARQAMQDLSTYDKRPSQAQEELVEALNNRPHTTEQLRVTLTGPTTSGKSTLLGTLSTGDLDNGYGKSRVDLLRHPHELESGMTSSVAQELVGYKDNTIFNYTHGNIETWVGIHDHTKGGRLVFLSDSAGHPRYRRTILRGLVGWAPHWTLLCIAVDDDENSLGTAGFASCPQEGLDAIFPGIDLAQAHLDLCLKLGMPLVVIVTKFDLATKSTVQQTVGKILSGIKAAERIPRILPQPMRQEPNLAEISADDNNAINKIVVDMTDDGDPAHIVPIIFTSAVKGTGIGLVHALLQSLPLPPPPTSHDFIGEALNPEQPVSLFHVEDKFSIPASYASLSTRRDQQVDMGVVIAGYMRFGSLSVGDRILVGPFLSEDDDGRGLTPESRASPGSYGLSLSRPSSGDLSRIAARNAVSASAIEGEWHHAHVVSIRNLRLSAQTLEAGQVGTIGIIFDPSVGLQPSDSGIHCRRPSLPKIRKGMVLAIPSKHMVDTGLSLQAASGLTASFRDPTVANLTVGSLVNIYVASVRAAARVVKVSPAKTTIGQRNVLGISPEDVEDIFGFNEQVETKPTDWKQDTEASDCLEVQLDLLTNREWIELGSQVLMLEGGHKDRSGLEGYVGRVVEIVD